MSAVFVVLLVDELVVGVAVFVKVIGAFLIGTGFDVGTTGAQVNFAFVVLGVEELFGMFVVLFTDGERFNFGFVEALLSFAFNKID